MVQRRAKAAGIATKIGCHTFRATRITIYLTNGGDLEKAQQMAAHESPRTTKLYDRRTIDPLVLGPDDLRIQFRLERRDKRGSNRHARAFSCNPQA